MIHWLIQHALMPTILAIVLAALVYVVRKSPKPRNTPEQRRGNWS